MTKKDYQAIAGALYEAKRLVQQGYEKLCNDGRDTSHAADEYVGRLNGLGFAVEQISDVLAADNPRFSRETFVLACEDGKRGTTAEAKGGSVMGENNAEAAARLGGVARTSIMLAIAYPRHDWHVRDAAIYARLAARKAMRSREWKRA